MKKILFSLLFVFCLIGVNAANNENSEFTLTETVQYGGQCDASKPIEVDLYSYDKYTGEWSSFREKGYVRKENGYYICYVKQSGDYKVMKSNRCEYTYMVKLSDGSYRYFNMY
ncbi:MAG: hypothetical protein J6R61_00755 [Bacteroidales bacterium]|nr:hypothetical protein [Bacteroidales bacterium]